jgi:hypothetical protein
MSQGFTKGTPIDTDPTLSINSDIVVPSQSAIKTYVDTGLATKVPTTRTLTINGVTYDLSADRAWTVAGGQVPIQWEDEGVALGTSGTVNEVDLVGQMIKGTRSVDKVTITAPSVGENLFLPSLDPGNALSAQVGAFSPNLISWTTTGKQNNLSLTGWNDAWNASTAAGKATIIDYSGVAYAICSGVVGGSNGRMMIITNSSNKLVILESESTDSSVGNRFRTLDGIACFVMPNEAALCIYYNSRWNLIEKQRWDVFDDFTGWLGAIPNQSSNSFYLTNTGVASSGLSQIGLISMQPAATTRSSIIANFNGGYSVPGTSTPVLTVNRIALSASISTFGRLALGVGGFASAAGGFYTGVCNGAIFGFASDSGIVNASTNFFIYSGPGGAANVAANGLDSGIPISQCVNNYNNFVVYFDVVNSVFDFFYSRNNGVYQYIGQRTQVPTAGLGSIWYEATNVARPTMWIDYSGQKSKIVTTR